MFCPVCRAELANDARFCPECGASIGDSNTPAANAPFYGGAAATPQMSNAPFNEQPAAPPPAYGAPPAYSAPPAYVEPPPPPPPAYGAPPAYNEPPQPPPPAYGAPPAHNEPPQPPPYGGAAPYGAPPAYGAPPPPYGGGVTPPPEKKNMMKIIIPIAAVVLLAVVFVILWLTGVLSFGKKNDVPPEPSSTREPARNTNDEGNTTETPTTPRPSLPPTTSPVIDTPDVPVTPSPSAGGVMPGGGGEVDVNGPGEVSFTPDRSGLWTLRTILNYDSDPYIRVLDDRGSVIGDNDDGAEDGNSFIILQLEAGTTYTIETDFYEGAGYYQLHASMAETIPPSGGDVRVNGGMAGYLFIPNESGDWTFTTSNNGNCDPYVVIFNQMGNYIAYDDDSLDGINAICTVYLDAGVTYHVNPGIYYGEPGSFVLTVTQGGGALTPVGDGTIPSNGGVTSVSGRTVIPFTPDRTGIWVIYTSNNGSSDPMLELVHTSGDVISEDDDGWGDYNAMLLVFISQGETYNIIVSFYGGGNGNCNVNVVPPAPIPAGGGSMQVNNASGFEFTPGQSGTWEIRASSNSDYPVLTIYDSQINLVDSDYNDDDDVNALMNVYLNAGQTYHILVEFWYDASGTCTLNVNQR